MTLAKKRDALIAELSAIKNGQERFAQVVQRRRDEPPLDAAFKVDAFRVEGCLSKLWFVPSFREGRCYFQSDSDSAIVKGIAGLLCEFYSGHLPAEIVAVEPTFLSDVGISQHLTPNRRNGLARLWRQIQAFAQNQIKTDSRSQSS